MTVPSIEALLAEHPVIDGHNDLLWAMRDLNGYDFAAYDVGERQGLTVAEVAARWPELGADWELGNPPPGIPGSESYDDVAARILPACREVLDSLGAGETALVVTHGACSKVAVSGLLGWPGEVAPTLRGLDNCHFVTLEQRVCDGRIRLAGYGVPPISRS